MDPAKDNEKPLPSLSKQILGWLAVAGVAGVIFWTVRSFVKDFRKNPADATMRTLLEVGPEGLGLSLLAVGGVIGGVYSHLCGKKERLEKKNHELEIENAVLKAQKQSSDNSPKKSWAATEQAKAEATTEAQLTR